MQFHHIGWNECVVALKITILTWWLKLGLNRSTWLYGLCIRSATLNVTRWLTKFWSTAHVFVHLSGTGVRYWASHSGGVRMSPGRRCGGSRWGVRLEELSKHSPFAFTFWDLYPSKSCAAEVAFSACLTPLMRPGNLRRLCQNPWVCLLLLSEAVILFKKSSANVIPSLTGLIGPHCVGWCLSVRFDAWRELDRSYVWNFRGFCVTQFLLHWR